MAGSTTLSKLYHLVKHEVISYDRYVSGELKVIGLPDFKNTDCVVNEKFSYPEWVEHFDKYTVSKVEGIESIPFIKNYFQFPVSDIHLFVSNKTSYSFKWHYDDVNVFLFVLKGQKRLQVRSKTYVLNPGQGALIPKRYLHRAFSRKGTWALSVGFK